MGFQTLQLRRDVFDALLAYDLYVRDIYDTFINSKIVTSQSTRSLRHIKLVKEQYYQHDYLRFQPIARLVRILNENSEIVQHCNSRNKFRSMITKKLSQVEC